MTSQMPQGYQPRIVDALVERYLSIFGAIEIAGTKWCGKTWTALAHASSVSYVEEAEALAQADPSTMLVGQAPHVIDEWQRVPAIWDATRRAVDRERGLRGAYILTGSSTPFATASRASRKQNPNADNSSALKFRSSNHATERARINNATPTHSGAGRIGRIRMHTMSLVESGDSTGDISLSKLFEGAFMPCKVERDTQGLVELACRGGWPEACDMKAQDAQLVAREYLNATLRQSIPAMGLDADLARRTVGSIARNLGQATTYKTIIKDMFAAENDPFDLMDEARVRVYLAALKDLYLLEDVPGWVPPARARKRFATKEKHYLADPSLATVILGMGPQAFMQDWQTFGLVFENMALRDLTVYARALDLLDDIPVRYYRDDAGLEVDAIIQLADGRWGAFECKVSEDKVDEAAANLRRFKKKMLKNERAQVTEPTFMAIIVGNGEYARKIEDGLYVIPLRALGA